MDVLHQKKTSEFKQHRSKKQEYMEEIETLQRQYKQTPTFELNTRIDGLKKKLEKSDPQKEVSYYLDAGIW